MHVRCKGKRFRVALVWACAALLGIMPGLAMAAEAPAGAFSRVFVHIHPLEDHEPHEHVTVHDHGYGHVHEHADHSHEGANTDGHGLVHIHYDVACPSGLVSFDGIAVTLLHRISARLSIPDSAELKGTGPYRLLRPPILPF